MIRNISGIVLLLALFVLPFAAHAEGKKKHEHKDPNGIIWFDNDEGHGKGKKNVKHGHKNCPPGLAKKNNGCLPPGIAKKYGIGERLPEDIPSVNLTKEILKLLPPVGKGRKYVGVDKDVYMIDEVTRKVIDIATILTETGK